MQNLLSRLGIDSFVISIHVALLAAAVVPAPAGLTPWLDGVTFATIATLFFLYGARISRDDALGSLVDWRLHLVVLGFTFVVFPVIGVALALAPAAVVDPALYPGVLFLCLVPSTVQASVGFTSLAGGNVPGAIASASASNLLGVFLTPALALALMTTTGATPVHRTAVLTIVLQILLPFVLGQYAGRWFRSWVVDHPQTVRQVGRTSIVLVIYAAFSVGERDHIWTAVTAGDVVQLVVLSAVLVCAMLWLTREAAERLRFARADVVAIQFCGTKKALVTGLPMASVLFAGSTVDAVVLPLMVFHQVQLIICAFVAKKYARDRAHHQQLPLTAPDPI